MSGNVERRMADSAVLKGKAEEDRRARATLRWALACAIGVHAGLFTVRWPAADAEPTADARPRTVVAEVERFVFERPDGRAPHRVAEMAISCGPPTIARAAPTPSPREHALSVRYRVGFEVGEPGRVFAPCPAYPEAALAARLEGSVVLELTIDRDGRVADVKVLRAGQLGMAEAAVEAVRRWRFEPSTVDGEPVEVLYILTVRFTLRR